MIKRLKKTFILFIVLVLAVASAGCRDTSSSDVLGGVSTDAVTESPTEESSDESFSENSADHDETVPDVQQSDEPYVTDSVTETDAVTDAVTATAAVTPTAIPGFTKKPASTPVSVVTAVPAQTPVPTATPAPLPQGETVADTDYSITFYWGPEYEDFTEAEVIRMKEAGFDVATVYNMPWGGLYSSQGIISYRTIEECVQLLDKYGINASVHDGRLTGVLTPNATYDQIERAVKRVSEVWSKYDNVTELYLFDEPSAEMFPTLAMAVELVRKYMPNCTTYINLLPYYATSDMTGTSSYKEYVETFMSTVDPDYISTDYYSFLVTGRRTTYAKQLEILKDLAERYGKETRLIVQLSEHMGAYKNITAEEIAWQANLALLYGMKQLSWYTYSHPITDSSSSNEMIDVNGNATQHYYEVQAENKVNRVLGNALYNTDVEAVFYIGTYVLGLDEYESYGRLGSIISGNDMLVSFYDNDSYFMMMSQFSEGTKSSCVTADIVPFLQWLNPETATWEDIDSCPYVSGKTVTLTAGQAVLFRR